MCEQASVVRRLAYWLLSLWLLGGSLVAQESPREFDEETLKNTQTQSEYQYGREPLPEVDTEEPNLIDWEKWRWVLYVLVAGFLIVVVVVILRNTTLRSTQRIANVEQSVEDPKDLEQLDLASPLKQALTQENYRLAIRLRFLAILKELTRRQMVDWRRYKTNYDYLNELPTTLREAFIPLIRTYEYVWYGEYPISQAQYATLTRPFDDFEQSLG